MVTAPITSNFWYLVQGKFTLQQAMKNQRYSSTLSLNSALDGGGWLTPRLGRFTPREIELVAIV